MYRIFYNPSSGDIQYIITENVAPQSQLPYIDVQDPILMNEWRVDPNTKTLEAIPEPFKPDMKNFRGR